MVDDVASFVAAAEVLKERGAYKIYVLATHGLLSSDAPRLIEASPIDEVNIFSTEIILNYENIFYFIFFTYYRWSLQIQFLMKYKKCNAIK